MLMIRVLILHDNPLFCLGLRSVLERHEEMQVADAFTLDQVVAVRPDVVLIDGALRFCLPQFTAVEAVAHMQRAGVRGIIVFARLPANEEDLFRFLMSGAAAYELPTISGDDLVEKIHRVARGEYLISSAVLKPARSKTLPARDTRYLPQVQEEKQQCTTPQESLCETTVISPRDIAILKQVIKSRNNKQIGQALGISDQTVRNRITALLKKFQVRDRTAAVVVALRQGLISLDDADRDGDASVLRQDMREEVASY
jgi:two-component system response regulator DegU